MYVYYKYTYIYNMLNINSIYVQQIYAIQTATVFWFLVFFLVALSKKVKIYDNTINREGRKERNVYLI